MGIATVLIAHKILLGMKRIAYRVFIRKHERKNQSENSEIDGRIILNMI
jgi:hypothetical protein